MASEQHVFYDMKRFVGLHAADVDAAKFASRYAFRLASSDLEFYGDDHSDVVRFELTEDDSTRRAIAAHELSSHVLSLLRESAAKLIGRPVKQCVIGVPVQFGDRQREYTAKAGNEERERERKKWP